MPSNVDCPVCGMHTKASQIGITKSEELKLVWISITADRTVYEYKPHESGFDKLKIVELLY